MKWPNFFLKMAGWNSHFSHRRLQSPSILMGLMKGTPRDHTSSLNY